MKRVKILLYLLLSMFFAVTGNSQDWANLKRYQKVNSCIDIAKNENRVVFIGNSITEGWENANPKFFKNNNYINRGISGQTTPQILLRFRQDVLDLKPKAVVILAGINDIAGNTGVSTMKMITDNIQSMVELSQANDIKVILCSVLPANTFSWSNIEPADKVIELNKVLKKMSENYHIRYVDYYSAMVDKEKGLDSSYGDDGVHPNIKGYVVMEKIVKRVIDKVLSTH